jgi:hypothetical protein
MEYWVEGKLANNALLSPIFHLSAIPLFHVAYKPK